VARSGPAATLLPNSHVLLAGGCGPTTCFNSAELYNPTNGTFTATGSMQTRALFTATLLPDGEVLAAGGENTQTLRLSSAELYNPSTGTWTSTGSLNYGRYGHTASLLNSGEVLIAGASTTAELYDHRGERLSLRQTYPPTSGTRRPYC
jgi:hypothetical protein